jgi:hypothetical protein
MENTEDITIDKEFIQHEAECCIHRQLTDEEYDEVLETLWEGLSEFVYYKVWEVMDIRRITEESKDADKTLPYYRAYLSQDCLGFDRIFEQVAVFKDPDDAKTFMRYHYYPREWQLVMVDTGGSEKEIYKSNY